MSKIHDALNDARKTKQANQAESKILKDVLGLLDEIQKKPEEIIKKRKEQGILSLGEVGKVQAFNQTYKFESGEQLKSFLTLLESAEKRIEEIRRQAGDYDVKIEPKSKTPDGLQQTLSDLSQKLESRLEKSRLEKLKLEEEAKGRQEKADALLKDGLAHLSGGRVEEAVRVFKELAAETGNLPQADKILHAIQNTSAEIRSAEDEFARLKSTLDEQLSIGETLEKTLVSSSQDAQRRLKDARAQKTQAEEALQGKQNLIDTFLHKGRAYFDEGKIKQAFEAWKELAVYTENPSVILDQIEALRRAESELDGLRKEISRLESLQKTKAPVPEDLDDALRDLSAKLVSQVEKTRAQKEQSEEALKDHQGTVRHLLEKGQALLAKKEWEGAFEVLDQLAGLTENPALIREPIERIRRAQGEGEAIEKEVERLRSLMDSKPEVPEELRLALGVLTKDLDSKLKASRSLKTETQEALEDRRKLLNSLLQKGRTLISQNRFEEAFEVFGELAGYTDDPALVKEQLQAIVGFQDDLEKVEAELRRLQLSLNTKPSAPEIVEGALAGLNKTLQSQLQKTKFLKTQSEEAVRSRQAMMDSLLEKGKTFFEQGQTAEALETWQELAAYTEDPALIHEPIERIRRARKETESLEKEVLRFQSLESVKPPVPEELRSTLSRLDADLGLRLKDSRALKSQAEEALEDREKLLNALLQKGRALLSQDRLDEAFEVFDELAKHTDNPALVAEQMDQIRRHQIEFEALDREVRQFQASLAVKPSAPRVVEEALSSLNQGLQSRLQKVKLQKTQVQEALKIRQSLVDSLLEKGKTFFEQGQTAEALETWQELAAYTENPSLVHDPIQRIRRAQGEVESLEHDADRLKTLAETKPAAPAWVESALAGLAKDTAYQIKQIRLAKAKSEEMIRSRRELIDSLFQKGKGLLEEGNREAAFETWQELASHLNDPSAIQDEIQRIRRAQGELEHLKTEADKSEQLSQARLAVPEELKAVFHGLAAELDSRSKALSAKKAQTGEALADRQNLVRSLLQKGSTLLAQDRLDEAFQVFSQLSEHTDNPELIEEQMESIRQFQNDLQKFEQEARRLQFLVDAKPSAPKIIEDSLEGLSRSLQSQLQKAKLHKTQCEEVLRARQSTVDSLIQKGQALFSQGKEREAFDAWRELSAHTENPALVSDSIQRLERARAEMEELKQENERLKSAIVSKAPIPEEVLNTFDRLNQELSQQREETEGRILEAQEAVRSRQELIDRFLYNARAFYEKNEVDQAITQWENAAGYVNPGSEFKEKINFIKDAYRNLLSIRNELARELHRLTEGMNPKPLDLKFVDTVHRSIRAEIKEINVALRAYLNLQNRAPRFAVSKPLITVTLLCALSFLGFWFYSVKTQKSAQTRLNQTVASYQAENTRLKTERSELKEEVLALKSQYQSKLAQLEGQVKAQAQQNKKIAAQINLLKEENLAKGRTIARLASRQTEP